MSVSVYALRFEDGTIYVGMTGDMDRRLAEHRRRQSPSLRRCRGEFVLVYKEVFDDYVAARRHEKYLKSGGGRKQLKSVRT